MNAEEPVTYECGAPGCTLGSVLHPGQFTGGITKEHAIELRGDPDAPYGEGYCPNCGVLGSLFVPDPPAVEPETVHEALAEFRARCVAAIEAGEPLPEV